MKRAALFLLLAVLLLPCCHKRQQEVTVAASDTLDTKPQMVSQIQRCSKLELTQYKIHVIAKYEDEGSKLEGSILGMDYNVKLPTGPRKIAIPIDATVHAYIDFSNFSDQQVEFFDDDIIITLPDPTVEILHTKVNNNDISTGVSFWRRDFTDAEITHIQHMSRDSIEYRIRKLEFTERARKQAATTLIPMLKQLGFDESHIKIKFRKGMNDNHLQFLYKIEEP